MPSSRKSATGSDGPPRPGARSRRWELTPQGNFWRASFTAMGSPCELLCETGDKHEADALATVVATEAWRIEDKFSRYIAGNVIDRINTAEGASVRVDEETAGLIDFASLLYDLSGGRFDITSGVLRRAWTFDGSDTVPGETEILDILQLVGWDKADWAERTLTMPAGMQIDLGGIGKEYAVDKATGLVRGQSQAACLVNFGGDLAVTGPPLQQPSWTVGREALQGPAASPSGLIQLKSGALATSGDTRRYLFRDGVRYSHILDPTTGWPIAGAPASITVAADTCVQAGMLCTLAMLQGSEAETMLEREGVQFWCTWS